MLRLLRASATNCCSGMCAKLTLLWAVHVCTLLWPHSFRDDDEDVRLAAVIAVCDCACAALAHVPQSLLEAVVERCALIESWDAA